MLLTPFNRRNIRIGTITLGASCLVFSLAAFADDWPQWHGPHRDGISQETGWKTSWPSEGLKPLWKADVGIGHGSMAVSRGRLYTMGNTADQDSVYCLDANTGQEIWKYTYACPAKDPNQHHGAHSTPTLDGNRVYTASRMGHLFCLDATTGKVVWAKEFTKDFGGKVPQWGYALSPLVEGDLLIVEPGGRDNSVVALKKETGETVWHAGNDPASYSSPYAFDFQGGRCVAVFSTLGLVVRSVKDGQELRRYPWKTSYDINVATPIFSDGKVFISSGYNTGCALVDIAADPAKEVWKNKNMKNHCTSCVLWKGSLYGFDESQLRCLDWATGEVKWSEKKYGKGTVFVADGKLVIFGDKGQLGVAEANAGGYRELAFTKALAIRDSYPGDPSKETWGIPVLANGKIYCRSQNDLVCLDVSGK
jgi:outer membrane protein assembly factor BamB